MWTSDQGGEGRVIEEGRWDRCSFFVPFFLGLLQIFTKVCDWCSR